MPTQPGYSSPRMPLRLPRRRFRQLCSTLGAVLALHLGVAQAAMAHPNMTPTRAAASAMDSHIDTPPCHEQVSMAGMVMPDRDTAMTPAKDTHPNHGLHHAPCCDEGACHCAAGCLPARLGIDAPAAKLLCEGLAPALQVGLARVQPSTLHRRTDSARTLM